MSAQPIEPAAVELDEKAQAWLHAYRQAKQRLDDDKEVLDRCRDQLEAVIGDAEVATVAGRPAIRYTTVSSNRLDSTKLKEQRPDVYDEFTRVQVTRRFTVVEA